MPQGFYRNRRRDEASLFCSSSCRAICQASGSAGLRRKTHLTRPSAPHLQILKDADRQHEKGRDQKLLLHERRQTRWKAIADLGNLIYEGVLHISGQTQQSVMLSPASARTQEVCGFVFPPI